MHRQHVRNESFSGQPTVIGDRTDIPLSELEPSDSVAWYGLELWQLTNIAACLCGIGEGSYENPIQAFPGTVFEVEKNRWIRVAGFSGLYFVDNYSSVRYLPTVTMVEDEVSSRTERVVIAEKIKTDGRTKYRLACKVQYPGSLHIYDKDLSVVMDAREYPIDPGEEQNVLNALHWASSEDTKLFCDLVPAVFPEICKEPLPDMLKQAYIRAYAILQGKSNEIVTDDALIAARETLQCLFRANPIAADEGMWHLPDSLESLRYCFNMLYQPTEVKAGVLRRLGFALLINDYSSPPEAIADFEELVSILQNNLVGVASIEPRVKSGVSRMEKILRKLSKDKEVRFTDAFGIRMIVDTDKMAYIREFHRTFLRCIRKYTCLSEILDEKQSQITTEVIKIYDATREVIEIRIMTKAQRAIELSQDHHLAHDKFEIRRCMEINPQLYSLLPIRILLYGLESQNKQTREYR